jgi:hypothetical protein
VPATITSTITGWAPWGLLALAASAFSRQAEKISMQAERRISVVVGIPATGLAVLFNRAIKIVLLKGSNIKSFNFH